MRVAAAFDWNGVLSPANIRVDAWVTPPLYTGKPPIILSAANKEAALPTTGPLPVPVGSTLIVRSSGGTLDVVVGRRRQRSRADRAGARRAPTNSTSPSPATAPRMSARPPASRHGSSPPFPTARRPLRWQRTRSVRPAARCRCPTRSRTITASPKRRRILPPAPPRRRRTRRPARRPRGRCSTRRSFRWCCRMRGPAMASARP